jgi:ATP-dependent Lon protease
MLDEIDKVGMDFRGDPSSALLEALDPEQNNAFSDHYLEVAFDLSQVLFITTANLLDTIPPPLLDRMEVIRLSGYTELEKIEIARRFLLPKELTNHGLTKAQLSINKPMLRSIILNYTREAGVRNLERELAKVCRKLALKIASGKKKKEKLDSLAKLESYLGVRKFDLSEERIKDQVGVATGVVWTSVGGDIQVIETAKMPGKGGLILTGYLGDVMKESCQAAMTYLRSNAGELGIGMDDLTKVDVHIHFPAGAIPKDGPSAGITVAAALISLFSGVKTKSNLAMTGEITLKGRVLPVGGLKEKLLGAKRAGIRNVIVPERNRKDIKEVPPEITHKMKFEFVRHLDDVLSVAFVTDPRKDTGKKPKAHRKTRASKPVAKKPSTKKRKVKRVKPGRAKAKAKPRAARGSRR